MSATSLAIADSSNFENGVFIVRPSLFVAPEGLAASVDRAALAQTLSRRGGILQRLFES
jgi:hypothetical protein